MKLKIFKIFILAAISLVYGLFLARQINLERMDLGRYIKNGEILCDSLIHGNLGQAKALLKTNFYSYTNTDFAVVNHHWGCSIPFYLIHSVMGFDGLHLIFIYASIAVFLVFFYAAYREAGFWAAAVISLFCIPLISKRLEIRPEVCTYLFGGLFYLLLRLYRNGKVPLRLLLVVIPLCEALWVNIHIYFVFGPFIIGCFILDALLSGKEGLPRAAQLLKLLGITVIATVFNPSGINGALYPFRIFDDYGYLTSENVPMNPFAKYDHISMYYLPYRLTAAGIVISFVYALIVKRRKLPVPEFVLSITFGVLSVWAIRNVTFFGFFSIAAFAGTAAILREKVRLRPTVRAVSYAALSLIISFYVYKSFAFSLFSPFGIGLKPGMNDAAEFIKREKLEGPVFNNFDIGGYILYHMFPQMRVFVDNRPEAYPAQFFKGTYIPMQENEVVWDSLKDTHNFNMIIFAHRDLSPWAAGFMARRLKDPLWKCVFADRYFLIFLKNDGRNKKVIEKFKIPENRFDVTEIEGGGSIYYILEVKDPPEYRPLQRSFIGGSSNE